MFDPRVAFFALALPLAACSTTEPVDGGTVDAGLDAGAPVDGGADAGVDAGVDGGMADAGVDAGEPDAGMPDAGMPDAGMPDAGMPDAPSCERTLLVGGMDVEAQGWSTRLVAPGMVSYGADYVQLDTMTIEPRTSGQLMLSYPGALTVPFRLEVVMLVSSVDRHNPSDAAAAILGSFNGAFGTPLERSQMIYLDADGMGFGDESARHAITITDGAYHSYLVDVDASGTMTVSVDGTPALMRPGFMTNGTLAIGDQTNDPNVDSSLRIRSVALRCP